MSSELIAALIGGLLAGGFGILGSWVTARSALKADHIAHIRESWRRHTDSMRAALEDATRYVRLIEARLDVYQTDPCIYGTRAFLEPGDGSAIWARLRTLDHVAGAALDEVMKANIAVESSIQAGNHFVDQGIHIEDDDECAKQLRVAIDRFSTATESTLAHLSPVATAELSQDSSTPRRLRRNKSLLPRSADLP